MNFIWRDYDSKAMGDIEAWLDDVAIKSTGLDDGFCGFFEYWANEEGYVLGQNFWCKVIYENNAPFGFIGFCQHECKVVIMEFVIQPEKRGQGNGTKILKQLIENKKITSAPIQRYEAVIFPNNIASKKAFENAGFKLHHIHTDGDALYYVYENGLNDRIIR